MNPAVKVDVGLAARVGLAVQVVEPVALDVVADVDLARLDVVLDVDLARPDADLARRAVDPARPDADLARRAVDPARLVATLAVELALVPDATLVVDLARRDAGLDATPDVALARRDAGLDAMRAVALVRLDATRPVRTGSCRAAMLLAVPMRLTDVVLDAVRPDAVPTRLDAARVDVAAVGDVAVVVHRAGDVAPVTLNHMVPMIRCISITPWSFLPNQALRANQLT
jgi:hypothetical protein